MKDERLEQIKATLAVEWRLKTESGIHHDHLSDLAYLIATLEYWQAKAEAPDAVLCDSLRAFMEKWRNIGE